MKVLIVLALIGVAYAGEAILAQAPLAYSSYIVDEPKPSYEYSTSVQTPNYNNYAHVRSGGDFERKVYNFAAPIAAAPIISEPIVAEAKFIQPAYSYQPLLKANLEHKPAFSEFRREFPIAAPAVALPTTKLLPIAYEPKPFYRFAAPALIAEPAPAKIVALENKFIGEGKSQYHSQNILGEATYGHREPFQAHDAVQDAEGNKAGSFSYVAPDGRLLTTEYIADKAGYRVASNALPVAPNPLPIVEKPAEFGDTEVVVEAKSRSRRSVAYTAPAPKGRALLYSSPYTYSSYTPAISSYSYAPSPSLSPSPSFYSSSYYRPYAYSYPSYSSYSSYPSLYYRNYAFRK